MISASPSVDPVPGQCQKRTGPSCEPLCRRALAFTLRLFVGDRDAIQLASGDEGIVRFELTVGRVPPLACGRSHKRDVSTICG